MNGRVKWTQHSYPYQRPGLGIGLLTFCVWVMLALFQVVAFVAKWTVILVLALVAFVVGWVGDRRGRHQE